MKRGVSSLTVMIITAIGLILLVGTVTIAQKMFNTASSQTASTATSVLQMIDKLTVANKKILIISEPLNQILQIKRYLEQAGALVEIKSIEGLEEYHLARYDVVIYIPSPSFITYSNFAEQGLVVYSLQRSPYSIYYYGENTGSSTGILTRGMNTIDQYSSTPRTFRLLKIYGIGYAYDTYGTEYSPTVHGSLTNCGIVHGTQVVNAIYTQYFYGPILRDYIIVPQASSTISIVDISDSDDTITYEGVRPGQTISTRTIGRPVDCTIEGGMDKDLVEIYSNNPFVLVYGVISNEYTTELQNVPKSSSLSLYLPGDKVVIVPLAPINLHVQTDKDSYNGEVTFGIPVLVEHDGYVDIRADPPLYKLYIVKGDVTSTYSVGYGTVDCILVSSSTKTVKVVYYTPEKTVVSIKVYSSTGGKILEDTYETSGEVVTKQYSLDLSTFGTVCIMSNKPIYYVILPDDNQYAMKLLSPVKVPEKTMPLDTLSKYSNVLYLVPGSLYNKYGLKSYVIGKNVDLTLDKTLRGTDALRTLHAVTVQYLFAEALSPYKGLPIYYANSLPVVIETTIKKHKVVIAPSSLLDTDKGQEIILALIDYLAST